MDLKHCLIKIPQIKTDAVYNGSFAIENNRFHFWVEWNKDDPSFPILFELIYNHEKFDAQIEQDDHSSEFYTCFECYSTIDLIEVINQDNVNIYTTKEPLWKERNIPIECNSWIEGVQIDSLSEKWWSQVSFRIDYSEPWFPSEDTNTEVVISDNESIHFFVGEQKERRYYPFSTTSRFRSQIVYENKSEEFSIEDGVHIGIVVQTLLRYTADIPFPPPTVEFIGDGKHGSIYRGNFGIAGLKKNPDPSKYSKMPYKMESLDIKRSVPKWFSFCNHDDMLSAIVNYCQGQNPDYINHRIVLLTRSFDKFSQTESSTYMDKEDFKLLIKKASEYIEHESGSVFDKNRVQSIISGLNKESLKNRLLGVFERMKNPVFKSPEDYRSVADYLTTLRHADAHSGYADITKLPDGYDYDKILSIIIKANRFCINRNALGK
ncbi:MAG: HEPN domain-containing protein [Sphaerochaetaceae bacterium]